MENNDRLAFVRNILANPADDTPRLVFADWLDEHDRMVQCRKCWTGNEGGAYQYHACRPCSGTNRVSNGNTERAEFIRQQIDGIQGPFEIQGALSPDFPLPVGVRAIVIRGFVSKVHLTFL